jgi:hypothetical protein
MADLYFSGFNITINIEINNPNLIFYYKLHAKMA